VKNLNNLNKFIHFFLIGCTLVLLCLGIQYGIENYLIMPGFYSLEQKYATEKMYSIVSALKREEYHLAQIAADWAAWDDMYKFVKDGNEEFIKSNFQWESLNASGIHLIYVIRPDGSVVWKGIQHPIRKGSVNLSLFSETESLNKFIRMVQQKNTITGLALTKAGPLFLSLQPILPSDKKGPMRGLLIMGRFFTSQLLLELRTQTNSHFKIEPLTLALKNQKLAPIIAKAKLQKFVFHPWDEEHLQGFSIIKDIEGKPLLLITAYFNRDIVAQGKSTAILTSYIFVAAFLIMGFLVVVWFVFFRRESHKREQKIMELVNERTQKLAESEEQLRTLINATPDIICFKDGQGRWLEANEADLELFDLKGVAYQGKKDSELADYTHPKFKNAFMACEATDEQAWEKGVLTRSEEKIETVDGTQKIYDVIKVPVFNEDGSRKGLIVFGRDVTQEKILQDRLQKIEKMQAIGLMAAGVAHDLNNILTGILAYPDLLLMQLPPDSELRKPIEAIREAGKRASQVVADLLTIARGVAAPKEPANLNELIKEYIQSPEFKKLAKAYPRIKLELKLANSLPNISCSPVHIKKCLMNLVTNAFEAVETEGKVTIRTKHMLSNEIVNNQSNYLKKGEYVLLEVSDSGGGISPQDLGRIFEPFYTKKVMGRSGTGLGLAIVWNTVNEHEGIIDVSSDEHGTTFSLLFPVTQESSQMTHTDFNIADLYGNGATILVVDDEVEQRNLLKKLLTELNYNVHTVSTGEEAIEFLRNNKVDLVILDMILGSGMNGKETYQKILEIEPTQKTIIVSGYCEDQDIREAQKLGAGEFIKKPYSLKEIGVAIKKILSS